jgi:23S rRNA pseudouridine2605 synthase
MILNKYISHCGIASRRKAVELIKRGLISVNNTIAEHPAYEVKKTDVVRYKGEVITPEKNKIYILMNKPKNTITSLQDESKRKTVIDLIKNDITERIYPVGRLDYQTTGLLLLTNDGDLAKKLSHPSHKVPKIYEVHLDKPIMQQHVENIQKGFELEDGPAKVNWIRPDEKDDKIVQLEIHMGKNRIVRRIFEHFNYIIVSLDRIYYAGLTKKGLKRGWYRHLTDREIIMLKHFS